MRIFIIISLLLIHYQSFSQPAITSFSPENGPVGTSIIITGTGFSNNVGNNIVFFGTVRGIVTMASSTSLSVTVPPGTSYHPITVTTAGLTGYSRKPFVITFPGGSLITTSSISGRIDLPPQGANTLAIKDIDNDGKPEIISGNIAIYKNNSSAGNPSFGSPLNISNPGFSYYLSVEDMDGDGKPDIVAPQYSTTSTIMIHKNTSSGGNISFEPGINFSTSGGYGIAVSDFDGDGLPDFVTTNNSGGTFGLISVHRNTSFGGILSFATNVNYSTGSYPRVVTTGFINADNKPDILVANQYGTSFSVFTNNSTPGVISFSPRVNFSTTTDGFPEAVAVGDFDGDDKADVVVTNNNYEAVGTVSVFRNTGSGSTISFAAKVDFTTGYNWYPYGLALGDIDGNGKPEIVVKHQENNAVSVFRNTSTIGTISFASKIDFNAADIQRSALCVSDLNVDGKPDICAGSNTPPVVSVFRNTIEFPNITSFSPQDACAGSTIIIRGNNFTGTFSVRFGGIPATSFSVLSDTVITAILGQGTSGAVTVINQYNSGTANGFTFTGPCILAPKIISFSPKFGSAGSYVTIKGQNFHSSPLNNSIFFGAIKAVITEAADTMLKVIVPAGATNKPITVTTNNLTAYSSTSFTLVFDGTDGCDAFTQGSFANKQDFNTGLSPYASEIIDIDGNGLSDVVVANSSSNKISLLRNISSLNMVGFEPHSDSTTGIQPLGLSSGDLDGDGKLDLAVANYASNTVSVFRNNSSLALESYATKIDFGTGTNPRGVIIQDIDADGRPDIIITNFAGSTISVLRNTSLGTGVISFATEIRFTTGSGPSGIFVLDIDKDNRPDVAVANSQSNTVSILKNISSGPGNIAFNAKIDYVTGTQPSGVFINDLDADESPDLVVSNNLSATVSIFKNTGLIGIVSFSPKVDYVTGSGPFCVAIADLNGDNKPELATANFYDGNVSILRNISTLGTIIFDSKMDFLIGFNPRSISIGDMNNDGKPDIISANNNDNTISFLKNRTGFVPGQICPGGGTEITASLSGFNFQWQIDNGSGFTNISDDGNHSMSNTNTLILTNPPSSWYGYKYRCIVDGNYSDTIPLIFINKWLGTMDSAWENPSNWNCNQLPDANTDVVINCAKNIVLSSNVICRSLSAKQGSTVIIKAGFILTLTQ